MDMDEVKMETYVWFEPLGITNHEPPPSSAWNLSVSERFELPASDGGPRDVRR